MSVLCPPRYADGPIAVPSRYGLYSVAQVLDDTEAHDFCGVQAEPFACNTAKVISPVCPPTVPPTKLFDDGVTLVTGDPFTVYASYHCRLPGRPLEEIQKRALAALALGEQRAVEFTLWTGGTQNAPAGTLTPRLSQPDCTVLNATPGAAGALSVPGGLAALEDYAAGVYSGTPVMHAPRGLSAYAASSHLVIKDGASLVTPVGSFWAFGSGYSAANTGPDGTTAPAGTAWMYVTGMVQIRRSEVFLTPPDATAGINRSTNEVTQLAERSFVLLVDCACAAVLVTLGCCC